MNSSKYAKEWLTQDDIPEELQPPIPSNLDPWEIKAAELRRRRYLGLADPDRSDENHKALGAGNTDFTKDWLAKIDAESKAEKEKKK